MESVLLDAAGHRRSPATMPGYHRGRPPRNKGEEYPADPPTVEEIVAVMRAVGDRPDGHRLRALIVLLWRAGLRISEALALQESDLDRGRGAVLVRRGKGGKRREVGMDRWAWDQLAPWLALRPTLAPGALFCVLRGPTRGRPPQTPSDLGLAWEPLECVTPDGLRLAGWSVTPSRPRATVILFHGLRHNRGQTLARTGFLAGAGYRCVAFDHRGHGESAGKRTSFGYYEGRDVAAVHLTKPHRRRRKKGDDSPPILRDRHRIIATLRYRLTNARTEAINTTIRLITRRAYGFHSPDALVALAMLKLGGYRPPLPATA